MSGQLGKLEIAVWGEWRRFEDQGIGCDDGWGDLAHCQQDWKVPWDETCDDSQWDVSKDDSTFIGVLDGFVGYGHCTEGAKPCGGHSNLLIRLGQGLALFGCQQLGEFIFVALNGIGVCHELLPTFFQASVGPWLEGASGSSDSLVDIFLGGDWDLWVRLGGGRVDVMTSFGGVGQVVVDHIVVCLDEKSAEGITDSIMLANTSNSSFGFWPLVPLVPLARWLEVAEGDMSTMAV